MHWLTHNPLANMYGPDFLLLYAVTIVVALIFGRYLIRNADTADGEPPLSMPLRPNPFELAFLRGGEQEVIRFTVFKLIQSHLLIQNDTKSRTIARVGDPAHIGALTGMERSVYESLSTPKTLRDLIKELSPDFAGQCIPFEENLGNLGLLAAAAVKEKASRVRRALLVLIFGLGFYKAAVALSRGRTNILFLVIIGFVGLLLALAVSAPPRISRRGKEYLEGLKAQLKPERNAAPADVDDEHLALQVAVLGVAVLAGTVYAEYASALAPPSGYSGDSDSSSGCGGGGGGDSSGGGDSGGGSGCGGCGGGGD